MTKNLKQVSIQEIEEAIANALTNLLGAEHKVAIGHLDFSAYQHVGGNALIPISMTINEVSKMFSDDI